MDVQRDNLKTVHPKPPTPTTAHPTNKLLKVYNKYLALDKSTIVSR